MNGHTPTFRASHYEYKVTLGTVGDKKTLSWDARMTCKTWEDVERITEAWKDSRDRPVIEVETEYRPPRE